MEWQIEGNPVRWKIMVITQEGIFFSGKESLVKSPRDAQWFDNYEKAVDQTKEIVTYNASGVTQIRLISSAFAESQ